LPYIRPESLKEWREVTDKFHKLPPAMHATDREEYQRQLVLTKLFDAAGVRMMVGTDGGGQAPGQSIHQEFDELAKAGLSPLKILQMTTLNPAEFLDRTATMGSIDVGKNADANVAAQFPLLINQGMGVELTVREKLNFKGPVYFSEHHLSHAASAFFCSPFEEAAIMTVDGVGEWATCAQFAGRGASIEKRREIHYPHSLGLLYSALTAFLGFKVNDDEYKIMGRASYGEPRFRAEFDQLIELHSDGSFTLSLPYFSYV